MKMLFGPLLGCALALLGHANPAEPFRRPVSHSGWGWQQVQLDAAAQISLDGAWLADEEGRPVPFLRERELPARHIELAVHELRGGRVDAGHVLAEFQITGKAGETIVASPEMRQLGYRAGGVTEVWPEMTLGLEIDATSPWVAEAEIARRLPSGEWAMLDLRVQLYDFGGEFRRLGFDVRRESASWRVRLKTIQGEVRGVRRVTARTPGTAMVARPFFRTALLGVSHRKEGLTLTLADGPQRVHGVDLKLKGVVAPVRAEVFALDDHDARGRETLVHAGSAQVWRMPGLDSSAGEVRFGAPLVSERFRVRLPEGVELEAAKALVREESLWFVAEQGHDYFLHFDSERKRAAGNLAELPDRLGERSPPVGFLGPRRDDPFGRPVREDVSAIAKRWLPWVVGLAVALLAVVALRMLRKPAQG